MAATLKTTAADMLNGSDAFAGAGQTAAITVSGMWVTGDRFLITITNTATGNTYVLGSGTVTGQEPTYLLTYGKKLNLLFELTWAFSGISLPTVFNNPNALGNGFVSLGDSYSESQNATAIALFQGKLALFGTNSIQIWGVDANPDNYQLVQVLNNIGTIAGDSVKSYGELDVFFLHSTGIRSLRVRDASSNGLTVDIGSPIDSLIKAKLNSASAIERAAACGVIDPNNSQYWLYVKDTLYVLSLFPSAKISAWATWDCSYQATADLGLRFKNEYSTTLQVSVGLGSNPETGTAKLVVGVGATSAALPPAKYLFVYDATGTTLLVTQLIDNGMSFAGVIASDTNYFTYTPNQTAFVPQKFENYNGQIFVSTSEGFYVYGGADNNTYDNTICEFETSWLDFDSPAVQKTFTGVDVAQDGDWNHYASPDYLSQELQTIMLTQANSTFAGGKIGWSNTGTHVKFRSQTHGTAERSVISNVMIHYKGNQGTK